MLYISFDNRRIVLWSYNSSNVAKHLKDVDVITSLFGRINVSDLVMNVFGRIKADLNKKGMRIDDVDLLIGASALSNGYVLVSDNTKHLMRIPEIRITNWIER